MKDRTAADALSALLRANPDLAVNGQVSAVVADVDPLEHAEQCAVVAWAREHEAQWPALQLLHSTPNGGYRHPATAKAMKDEGQLAGIPDLVLPVARRGFNSLYLEMKRIGGRPSPHQVAMIELLRCYGNQAVIAYGASEAIKILTHYLSEDR